MLLAFTGLHSAGKSYIVNNIPQLYGFKVFDKKAVVRNICKSMTGRNDYMAWYGEEFEKDPVQMTSRILDALPLDEDIVLDAVHSNLEWEIIKELVPGSYLALVVTNKEIREERWELRTDDGSLEMADFKRLYYWHNKKGNSQCLVQYADWAFNGRGDLEFNKKTFEEFLKYAKEKEKVKEKK